MKHRLLWLLLLTSCMTPPPTDLRPEALLQSVRVAARPPQASDDTRSYRSDWSRPQPGEAPWEFVDVRHDGHQASWLYDGGWRVALHQGEAILEVPYAKREPREPLTFRRYNGSAFGSAGALPERYRIEAEARSLGGSTRFNGYGEVAMQVFYVSPDTYVEVLQTDQHLYIWEAREAPPMQGKGWRRLARITHPARLGDWVRFGAEVDRPRRQVTLLLDGNPVGTVRTDMLAGDQPAKFTIRATGNREEWRWIDVRELP